MQKALQLRSGEKVLVRLGKSWHEATIVKNYAGHIVVRVYTTKGCQTHYIHPEDIKQ